MSKSKIEIDTSAFYSFGGMKHGQNTKLHIISNNCITLCGVKSFWMEASQNKINNDGYQENKLHLFPITDVRSNTCAKCLKRWKILTGKKNSTQRSKQTITWKTLQHSLT